MDLTPRVVFLALSLFAAPPASAQQRPLGEIQKKLRAIELKDEDFPGYDVPKEAQELLPLLKQGIREVIVRALESEGSIGGTSQDLRASLLARLAGEGLSLETDVKTDYGGLRKLEVQVFNFNPGLVAVKSEIGIACGVDSSLLVFQRKGQRWAPAIFLESGQYREVKGAIENLEYRLSPTHGAGGWYLLVAFSRPWCTSCWSGVHYKVLRPTLSPGQPSVAYESNQGFYRCANQSYNLAAKKDEFALSYPSMMSLDFDLFARISVDRFRIEREGVQRIHPKSQRAVDFVDEWVELPEEQAMALVSESARALALEWHRRLTYEKGRPYESRYDFVQPCEGMTPSWQIGLSIKPNGKSEKGDLPPYVFFEINSAKDGVVLSRVGSDPLLGCVGPKEKPTGVDLNDLQLPVN